MAHIVQSRQQLLQCPYAKEHMIQAGRFQHHLVKCRKNHPTEELVSCPFNACHVIPKPELSMHISNCLEREYLDKESHLAQKIKDGKIITGNLALPDFNQHLEKTEENWDEDEDRNNDHAISDENRIRRETSVVTVREQLMPDQVRKVVQKAQASIRSSNSQPLRQVRTLPKALMKSPISQTPSFHESNQESPKSATEKVNRSKTQHENQVDDNYWSFEDSSSKYLDCYESASSTPLIRHITANNCYNGLQNPSSESDIGIDNVGDKQASSDNDKEYSYPPMNYHRKSKNSPPGRKPKTLPRALSQNSVKKDALNISQFAEKHNEYGHSGSIHDQACEIKMDRMFDNGVRVDPSGNQRRKDSGIEEAKSCDIDNSLSQMNDNKCPEILNQGERDSSNMSKEKGSLKPGFIMMSRSTLNRGYGRGLPTQNPSHIGVGRGVGSSDHKLTGQKGVVWGLGRGQAILQMLQKK